MYIKTYLFGIDSNLHGKNFFHDFESFIVSQRLILGFMFFQQFAGKKNIHIKLKINKNSEVFSSLFLSSKIQKTKIQNIFSMEASILHAKACLINSLKN